MSYFDIANEAIELVVVTDAETGASYLEPCYRAILDEANIHLPGRKTYGDKKDQELYEIVQLEVEKRNAKTDFMRPVFDWVFGVLTNGVEPALEQEENELMKNMLEYMKVNNEKKELEAKEEAKEEADGGVPNIEVNFSKKEI